MKNERGGILSKIITIPLGVALMAGVFLLGYYTGKAQNKSEVPGEIAPPLPELASGTSHTSEEFTFYKTLTEKNGNTVSIDLKSKPAKEENLSGTRQTVTKSHTTVPAQSASKEKRIEVTIEKEAPSPMKPKQAVSNQPQPPVKNGQAVASRSAKFRYTVQTASYREKEMAEDEVRRLKKRGYAAFIASSELPGKGIWHRVRLGSFANKAEAEKLQKTVQAKEGISPIITIE